MHHLLLGSMKFKPINSSLKKIDHVNQTLHLDIPPIVFLENTFFLNDHLIRCDAHIPVAWQHHFPNKSRLKNQNIFILAE